MPTISITLSQAHLDRLIEAESKTYVYESIVDGAPNPETEAQFARRMLIQQIKDFVRNYENNKVRSAMPGASEIGVT